MLSVVGIHTATGLVRARGRRGRLTDPPSVRPAHGGRRARGRTRGNEAPATLVSGAGRPSPAKGAHMIWIKLRGASADDNEHGPGRRGADERNDQSWDRAGDPFRRLRDARAWSGLCRRPFLGLFLHDLVHQVQPLSLVLNGVTALFSLFGFAQSGLVMWKPAILLAVVTTVAAPSRRLFGPDRQPELPLGALFRRGRLSCLSHVPAGKPPAPPATPAGLQRRRPRRDRAKIAHGSCSPRRFRSSPECSASGPASFSCRR